MHHRDYHLLRKMIIDHTDITENEFDFEIQKYKDFFGNLADEEGLIYILAKETNFDLKIYDNTYIFQPIAFSSLKDHLGESVTIKGEFMYLIPPRIFNTESKRTQLATIYLRGDDISHRILFWNTLTSLLNIHHFKKNFIYQITHVKVIASKEDNNGLYLNITSKSEIEEYGMSKEESPIKVKEIYEILLKSSCHEGFFNIKGVFLSIIQKGHHLQEIVFRDTTDNVLIKLWGDIADLDFSIPTMIELKNVGIKLDLSNHIYPLIGNLNDKEDIKIIKKV